MRCLDFLKEYVDPETNDNKYFLQLVSKQQRGLAMRKSLRMHFVAGMSTYTEAHHFISVWDRRRLRTGSGQSLTLTSMMWLR